MRAPFALILCLGLAGGCITAKHQQQAAARVELGRAYYAEGATESAIATLMEATELDRRNVDAWSSLGMALMKRGELDQAEDAFLKALKLDSEPAGTNLNYAYLLQKVGRVEDAIPYLETARADLTYRSPAAILNNLGFAYLQVGRTDDAIRALEDAVGRQPNYCQALLNLGLAYEAGSKLEPALGAYDRMLMLCPEFTVDAYFRGGVVLLELGRREEGAHYLRKVMESAPGSEASENAVARLQEEGLR